MTKSIEMSDHGLEGMGRSCGSPMHDLEEVLFLAQTEHASMYSWTHEPEPLRYNEHGSPDSRMTSEQRGVGPMNHLWAQINRDKQMMLWAPTRWWRLTIRLLHLSIPSLDASTSTTN